MSWKFVLLEPMCILHFLHPKSSRLIRCGRVLPSFMTITRWHVHACVFPYVSVCLYRYNKLDQQHSRKQTNPLAFHKRLSSELFVVFFYDLLWECPATVASLPSVLMQKYEDAHFNISRYMLWLRLVPRVSPGVSQNCMENKLKSFPNCGWIDKCLFDK